MNREMRRQDRALSEAESKEILKNESYGVLSTVSRDGQPYGVPVSYVYDNDAVYFHCALQGHKLDNLTENSRVSFCVVGSTCILPELFSTLYESVIVFGEAKEVSDEEKHTALLALLKKYSPQYLENGKKYIEKSGSHTKVIKISIEQLTGKAKK